MFINGGAAEQKKMDTNSAITQEAKETIKTTYFHSLQGWKRTPSKNIEEKDLAVLKKKKNILLFSERHIVADSNAFHYK